MANRVVAPERVHVAFITAPQQRSNGIVDPIRSRRALRGAVPVVGPFTEPSHTEAEPKPVAEVQPDALTEANATTDTQANEETEADAPTRGVGGGR